MTNLDNWTKDDFLSLLCLCGAKADMEISEDEIDWIIKYFGEDSYNRTRSVFDQQSDYETLELLKKLNQRFYPDEGGKAEIQGNLRALFSADGEYSQMEKSFERVLTRLF